ncbi:MAG TPA: LysM peptidoglycan-binding domain-containing protein [Acidimicrobiia bacterium]|nr:LysM peptidoglycan-binding domain-containing protein [Acidimicrobiia bacterium]
MTRQPTVPMRMLVIISIAVAALLLLASAVQATGEPVATIDYRVEAGDTLWSIAAETGAGSDVRATISAIKRINDLDGSLIYAGQVLELPALVASG